MDIDGDGFVSVGVAKTFVFPPANAPAQVDDAWKQATAGLDGQALSTLEMTMHLAGGIPSGGTSDSAQFGAFHDLVRRALEGLEISRKFQNADQRVLTDKLTDALQTFDKALSPKTA